MNHIVSSVELSTPMRIMSFCSSYLRSYEAKCGYKLFNPINCQFWHHSWAHLEELPWEMMSHPYFIFSNKQDTKYYLLLLSFSYHWETLCEPHCWWHYVKFTHAGQVILLLILYKLWSKMLLQAFLPINCQFWHYICIWLEELPQDRARLISCLFLNIR